MSDRGESPDSFDPSDYGKLLLLHDKGGLKTIVPGVGAKQADKRMSDLFRRPRPLDCPRCSTEKFWVLVGIPGRGQKRARLQCPDCRTVSIRVIADEHGLSGLLQFRCGDSRCTNHWPPAEIRFYPKGPPPEDPPSSFVQIGCARSGCNTWMPLVQLRAPQLDDYRAKNLGVWVPDTVRDARFKMLPPEWFRARDGLEGDRP